MKVHRLKQKETQINKKNMRKTEKQPYVPWLLIGGLD